MGLTLDYIYGIIIPAIYDYYSLTILYYKLLKNTPKSASLIYFALCLSFAMGQIFGWGQKFALQPKLTTRQTVNLKMEG